MFIKKVLVCLLIIVPSLYGMEQQEILYCNAAKELTHIVDTIKPSSIHRIQESYEGLLDIKYNPKKEGLAYAVGNSLVIKQDLTTFPKKAFRVDRPLVKMFAFHPSGKFITAVHGDNLGSNADDLYTWNIELTQNQQIPERLPFAERIHGISYNKDGQELAVRFDSSKESGIATFDIAYGNVGVKETILKQRINHGVVCSYNNTLVYHPDDRDVVTAFGDAVSVWDLKNGKLIIDMHDHGTMINSISYDVTGRYIVSSGGKSAYVWDTRMWKQVHVLQRYDKKNIQGVSYSPLGDLLFLAGHGVCIIDVPKMKIMTTLNGFDAVISMITYSVRSEKMIAASCIDGYAYEWDLDQISKYKYDVDTLAIMGKLLTLYKQYRNTRNSIRKGTIAEQCVSLITDNVENAAIVQQMKSVIS